MNVLAIDIERSGQFDSNETMAIGCCVIDESCNIVDRGIWKCYSKDYTNMEPRCHDEFWSKNLETLEKLSVPCNSQEK